MNQYKIDIYYRDPRSLRQFSVVEKYDILMHIMDNILEQIEKMAVYRPWWERFHAIDRHVTLAKFALEYMRDKAIVKINQTQIDITQFTCSCKIAEQESMRTETYSNNIPPYLLVELWVFLSGCFLRSISSHFTVREPKDILANQLELCRAVANNILEEFKDSNKYAKYFHCIEAVHIELSLQYLRHPVAIE